MGKQPQEILLRMLQPDVTRMVLVTRFIGCEYTPSVQKSGKHLTGFYWHFHDVLIAKAFGSDFWILIYSKDIHGKIIST
jgi:hypothetical protein